MATEVSVSDAALQATLREITAFWNHWDFWILLVIGIAGLYFSVKAFREAKKARVAAIEAGRTVKIQTVTIELTEISQKLDKLEPEIRFSVARDLLSETTRRLRRAVSPFRKDPAFVGAIDVLLAALDAAKTSLNAVRPADSGKESETPQAIYFGIEGDLSAINSAVADLTGLFEGRGITPGDYNATK